MVFFDLQPEHLEGVFSPKFGVLYKSIKSFPCESVLVGWKREVQSDGKHVNVLKIVGVGTEAGWTFSPGRRLFEYNSRWLLFLNE
jgi:hypothetical protein